MSTELLLNEYMDMDCDSCLLFCKYYMKTSQLPPTQLNLWSVRRNGASFICISNMKPNVHVFGTHRVTWPQDDQVVDVNALSETILRNESCSKSFIT